MPSDLITAEIIAVGSELLTPHRLDTNSLLITAHLNDLGVAVVRKTQIGDDRAELAHVIAEAFAHAQLVVVTGGLGPTEDDLTREASADALGVKLRRDPRIEAGLRRFFGSRGIVMPERNLKQADVLEDGEILVNPNGTAPGQLYRRDGRALMLLPGPPRELRPMFEKEVLPRLREIIPARHLFTKVLKIADRPESQVDDLAAPVYTRYPGVQTTILATQPGEIELHFRAIASSLEVATASAETVATAVAQLFGSAVFSTEGESLEEVVGKLLRERNDTVAVAESCTAGMVAKRITDVAGASAYFLGGIVCYDNRIKRDLVGVKEETLASYGAVSKETAVELAQGVRARCNSDWAVAVTGIAGPEGGTPEKPVGLVYIAIAGANRCTSIERRFGGDRDRIRKWTAQVALDQLRIALLQAANRHAVR